MPDTGRAPTVEVVVDRRVELLAIVFRLAEAEEYSMRTFPRYAAAVDTFFAAHRGHPVVAEVRRLRRERGISHDAVMSLAIHLTSFPELAVRMPLEGSALDRRWVSAEAHAFMELVRDFARVSDAARFFEQQGPTYDVAVQRMRERLRADLDQAWFPAFYGAVPRSRFIVAVAPGNGHWAYGRSVHLPSGAHEMYSVNGVDEVDAGGMPTVQLPSTVRTIVHEFSHSFVNPVVDRRMGELRPAADSVVAVVAARMRAMGYTETPVVVSESLVRAAVARYQLAHGGEEAARRELEEQKLQGFFWMEGLYDLLGAYERERDRYPTLEAFFPRIAEHFATLTTRLPRVPRVVSMTPANGSERVDPATTQLVFRFDQPMRGSYATMLGPGGRERFPESPRTGWDSTGTVFTMNVRLKPGWSYEFALNSQRVAGFLSREGIGLPPYVVRFTTAPARQASPPTRPRARPRSRRAAGSR